MFAKVKNFFGKKTAPVAFVDTTEVQDTAPEELYPEFFALILSAAPVQPAPEPKDRVEVPVGGGLGKAVVQRPYYDTDKVSLSYNSNFGASYNAGPITLTVDEWDELVQAVESVLAEKPAVEVTLP